MLKTACVLLLTSMNGNQVIVNPAVIGLYEEHFNRTMLHAAYGFPNWEVKETVQEVYEQLAQCPAMTTPSIVVDE